VAGPPAGDCGAQLGDLLLIGDVGAEGPWHAARLTDGAADLLCLNLPLRLVTRSSSLTTSSSHGTSMPATMSHPAWSSPPGRCQANRTIVLRLPGGSMTGQYPSTKRARPEGRGADLRNRHLRTSAVTGHWSSSGAAKGADPPRARAFSRGGEPEMSDASVSGTLRAGTVGERDAGRRGCGARCRAGVGAEIPPAGTLASRLTVCHPGCGTRGS
jgi:hypothetical protein